MSAFVLDFQIFLNVGVAIGHSMTRGRTWRRPGPQMRKNTESELIESCLPRFTAYVSLLRSASLAQGCSDAPQHDQTRTILEASMTVPITVEVASLAMDYSMAHAVFFDGVSGALEATARFSRVLGAQEHTSSDSK